VGCPAGEGEGGGLELADLVRRPARRHADQRVGDRAFGEIVELPELAAQRDVDRHQHLLHRRVAVDPVGAHVARPIDDVAHRIVRRPADSRPARGKAAACGPRSSLLTDLLAVFAAGRIRKQVDIKLIWLELRMA
jgi:hypothetical protein